MLAVIQTERQPIPLYTERQRQNLSGLSTAMSMLNQSPKDILQVTLVVHLEQQEELIKSLCIDFSTGDIYFGLVKEDPSSPNGISLESVEGDIMTITCPPGYRPNRKRDQQLFVHAALTMFQQAAEREIRGNIKENHTPTSA